MKAEYDSHTRGPPRTLADRDGPVTFQPSSLTVSESRSNMFGARASAFSGSYESVIN
jgi:hypothetical protein